MRPHDLLFLRRPGAFEACGGALPDWCDTAWLTQAPLVVRRAPSDPGYVAAGARGLQRNERCAGRVAVADVARCVTPTALAREVLRRDDGGRLAGAARALPCVAALLDLAPRLQGLGLDWGPVGGAGFWLASGLPVLRPASDLDLLVRSPGPLSPDTLAALSALSALQPGAACRIDIQVDTGAGGFALGEYLREHARGGRVLLKTARGPVLVADPWQALESASEAA